MGNYKRWRNYQRKLQRKSLHKRLLKRSFWFLPLLLFLGLGAQFLKVNLSTGSLSSTLGIGSRPENPTSSTWMFAKKDLRELLDPQAVCNGSDGSIEFSYSGRLFSIETTLDTRLQGYMLKRIETARSPLIGFVAMDPTSGQIISMIDSKKTDEAQSICLNGEFPAASVFKIVSAAAAIEACSLSADTKLTYNGRRHTLYRNQLTEGTNRYTNRVSLKDSFAKSINPAFGKLGIFRLGKGLLEEYANRFGFNESIDFEFPVEPSRISVGDDPYEWAEVACGFNRKTSISPIHGAMIAAAILNGGKLVEPTIVKKITDNEKNPVHSADPNVIRQAISPKTSQEMMALMKATISRGTSRRTFKGYRSDRVLSKLVIGGKTGSIKSHGDELLYDWFVGFGAEKAGGRKLAIAVLVVHDRLLRARAQEYARLALRYYFGKTPSPSCS
jgi:cell division protein FtsI/penicillin-binding protein 2